MRLLFCGWFFCAASGILLAANDEPALPVWDAEERAELEASGWVAGSILLTNDPIPDEAQDVVAEPLKLELPNPEEIIDDLSQMKEVAEKFLPAYFAERPKSFLIDPQGLMSSSDYRDRLEFLNYHASDSSIDLFVYVLSGDQEIPSEVREEEMIERFFAEGRPAAIVYYYLGAPQRSVVYLSPSITDSISSPEQRRALESSVMQAFEKTNASEQFARFLVQMSIRIYWMERELAGESASADESPESAVVSAVEKKAKREKFPWLRELAIRLVTPALILLGIFLAGFGLRYWVRLRSRYRFPEFEVEPRLGGSHAAGVGAVISFASATVPPASQRDQVPDYLRRI